MSTALAFEFSEITDAQLSKILAEMDNPTLVTMFWRYANYSVYDQHGVGFNRKAFHEALMSELFAKRAMSLFSIYLYKCGVMKNGNKQRQLLQALLNKFKTPRTT